jgi:lambda family phage portal protein
MGAFQYIEGLLSKAFGSTPQINDPVERNAIASSTTGRYTPIFTYSFDGEKNLGELGPAISYQLDYSSLRARSWQSYLESEITKIVIDKYTNWIIGGGLNLHSEVNKIVLAAENVAFDSEAFAEITEARFSLFAGSEMSDYSGVDNLHKLAATAFKNSNIGGDCLVVCRYEDFVWSVQLIDGVHVESPLSVSTFLDQANTDGNVIRDGIETDARGRVVAYYVRVKGKPLEYDRILAKSPTTGLNMAFMVNRGGYRIDNRRGIPLAATVLETLKKLERYKEATVGSAEERAKIALSIEHNAASSGENPFQRQAVLAFNADADVDLPEDSFGTPLSNVLVASANKQAINLPVGAALKAIDSKNELYFKDFFTTNIGIVCAALGVPPEVALSKYDSNYSASRAALKDWEKTIMIQRKDFAFQFYRNIYSLWLDMEIMTGKIYAPGYLTARTRRDKMLLESYRTARWVGDNIPHIDPYKEVQAERLKLGDNAGHIPLTTVEQATQALNGGDSDANAAQFSEELKQAAQLGIIPQKTKSANDANTQV